MSYFDNGEEFGGDSDDNMDEAIYWNTSTQHARVHFDINLHHFSCVGVQRNRPAAFWLFNCFIETLNVSVDVRETWRLRRATSSDTWQRDVTSGCHSEMFYKILYQVLSLL